jgi:hypothetical protein
MPEAMAKAIANEKCDEPNGNTCKDVSHE